MLHMLSIMDQREFMRRWTRFTEAWAKVSCIGIIAILLIILVTNLIW